MRYTYLCDEDMLPYLQLLQTGHSSDSLRDFSQSIISQYTTLCKEKMYQSKAFDSTNKGWLILIVKLAIPISFVGKLKRKACGSCFFGTPLVFSKIFTCIFISRHHVIKIIIMIPIMIMNMIMVTIMIMITITIKERLYRQAGYITYLVFLYFIERGCVWQKPFYREFQHIGSII